jgi:hypothetical protein
MGRAVEIKAGTIEGSHQIDVLNPTPGQTQVRFQVGTFSLRPVSVDGESYSALVWGGGHEPLQRGNPALPGFRESIVVPEEGEMTIQVLESEYQDYPGVRIAPSKGTVTRDIDPDSVPWEFSNVYAQNAWYPAAIASLGQPYILRDERGIVVAVDPFQWNPVTQTLRVYTSVTIEVRVAGPGGANPLTHRPPFRVSEFQKIYARHFLNWNSMTRYAPVGEVGPMLVVAADIFVAATQPLVDWKNQMGVPTALVPLSSIGTTATQLKSYIHNVYDTQGLCFILLVGDAAQIPYFNNGGGAADPMMTLLAGSDNYPDAFIGRISAETVAQVDTQVERTIEYERNPDPSGVWYQRGVAIASNEGDGYGDEGEADWEHAQHYRADLLRFTYTLINELYDGDHPSNDPIGGQQSVDQPGNPSSANLSPLLNSGRGFIHYTGHGSTYSWATTGFDTGDINALTNDNMLPTVVSVGCVNGAFMSTTCFAEAWMRRVNGTEPAGAIACYASTVNQQWATPMEAQDEMIALLIAEQKWTFGGTCFNGSCSMIDHYGANGITEFKNWHIFGDPSLQMRTSTPEELTATHADHVDAAAGTFQVTTAPEAMVALSHQGALLGSTFADVSGLAIVTFDPVQVGALQEVTLTVTGFNRIPEVETVPVQAGATAVAEGSRLVVGQNWPNPFAHSTGISLMVHREGSVQLEIFDVAGRKIRTLDAGVLPAGSHNLVWDGTTDEGRPATAGTYFYRALAPGVNETRRMVRLR